MNDSSYIYSIPHLEDNTYLQIKPIPPTIHTLSTNSSFTPKSYLDTSSHVSSFNHTLNKTTYLPSTEYTDYFSKPRSSSNIKYTPETHSTPIYPDLTLVGLTNIIRRKRKQISSALGRLRSSEDSCATYTPIDRPTYSSTLNSSHSSFSPPKPSRRPTNSLQYPQDYILELQDFMLLDENKDPNCSVPASCHKRSYSYSTSDKSIQTQPNTKKVSILNNTTKQPLRSCLKKVELSRKK